MMLDLNVESIQLKNETARLEPATQLILCSPGPQAAGSHKTTVCRRMPPLNRSVCSTHTLRLAAATDVMHMSWVGILRSLWWSSSETAHLTRCRSKHKTRSCKCPLCLIKVEVQIASLKIHKSTNNSQK